jgi:ACS family tartrate transporter-like MFS transporter
MSEQQIFTKCALRLIPFMGLLYAVNFVDRVNVGFAALTMNKDLGFSPSVYGLGAGVFFLGYFLFQVPANWMLERIGARRWVFGILALWGLISASHVFVQGTRSFYTARFLLGAAEAGFMPGMLLYMSYWFPQTYLARYTAMFQTAIPISFVIGGPLASLILRMDGVGGLYGWQWLFLLEGIFPFLLSFTVLRLLPDSPARASWLSREEKENIVRHLARDATAEQRGFWLAFRDPRVFVLGFVLFGQTIGGLYGIGLWLPQIVQSMGVPNEATGFVVAIPYVVCVPLMILWGRSSDLRRDRIWHIAIGLLLAAGSFFVASATHNDLVVFVALGLTAVCALSIAPPLNSLVKSILSGPAAAGGIAIYNSIGNLGGLVGPYIIGALMEKSGNYASSMAVLASVLVLAALTILAFGRNMALHAPAGQAELYSELPNRK